MVAIVVPARKPSSGRFDWSVENSGSAIARFNLIQRTNASLSSSWSQGYQTYSNFRKGYATLDLTNCRSQSDPVHFELKLIRGLLFTDYMIAPTDSERVSSHLPDGICSTDVPTQLSCSGSCSSTKDVNALTRDQLRALWHMRLGHINERLVSETVGAII